MRYCPNCFNRRHTLRRAVIGFFAWQVWRVLPTRLAFSRFGYAILPYAGDWMYDTRGCGCGVALVEDQAA